MKILPLLALLALLPSAGLTANLVNLGPAFDQFLTDSPRLGQRAAWEAFENSQALIYSEIVHREGSPGWEQNKELRVQSFFGQLPKIQNEMQKLFREAPVIVAQQEEAFRQHFPDLREDTKVFFLPSLLTFNGKVAELKGSEKPIVLFGVDVIALRNDDLGTLFSHEFFHAYHAEKSPTRLQGDTMANPLWNEGIATFVSGLLNPQASDAALFMDEKLAGACASAEFRAKKAADYLAVLDKDGPMDEWFSFNPDRLSRVGYCLGFHAVRIVAENQSVNAMITWPEERFSRELRAALEKMATLPRP